MPLRPQPPGRRRGSRGLAGAPAQQNQQAQHRDSHGGQQLGNRQAAAIEAEQATGHRPAQGEQQQPGADEGGGGPHPDQQEEVIQSAEGMAEASGQAVPGQAMGGSGQGAQQAEAKAGASGQGELPAGGRRAWPSRAGR